MEVVQQMPRVGARWFCRMMKGVGVRQLRDTAGGRGNSLHQRFREGVSFHQELLTGAPGRARDKDWPQGVSNRLGASRRWDSRDQPAEPLPQSLSFIGPFPFVDGNWWLKLL